jgi:nephrocystin-3
MHPDYAGSLGNIGNIYLSKGDYDKALEYYFKSIEIQKIVLG